MPSWRRVFTSEEARIEGLAGACPPGAEWDGFDEWFAKQRGHDFPMPVPPPYEADDEDKDEPC